MSDSPGRAGSERCASCGAAMRADAPWCSLCLTPRPAPEPVPVARQVAQQVVRSAALYPMLVPSRAAGGTPPPTTWPCLRCSAQVPLAADLCPDCGARFLGGSSAPAGSVTLPLVGDLASRSRTQVFAIAAVLGLTLAVLAVVAVLVVSALL